MAKTLAKDHAYASLLGQGQRRARHGLIEERVVQRQHDFDVARLNCSAVEIVVADPQADVAYETLFLHLQQFIECMVWSQRFFNIRGIVDQDKSK